MAQDTTYPWQSNHFDILSAINQMISLLPITWNWRHIKGHQDNMIGPLGRWAALNAEMDKKAKARRRIDKEDPPSIQSKVKHKIWRTYIVNKKGNTKISTELDKSQIKGNAINNF
eukprot:15323940-Ditylum_brightwellii.AAC.2